MKKRQMMSNKIKIIKMQAKDNLIQNNQIALKIRLDNMIYQFKGQVHKLQQIIFFLHELCHEINQEEIFKVKNRFLLHGVHNPISNNSIKIFFIPNKILGHQINLISFNILVKRENALNINHI